MTYGIIKNKDASTYVSPIFALKYVGWKSEAIIFDETFSKIKRIKLHDTRLGGIGRTVFVIENDFDTSKGDWAGFDWVINDKALFKALRSKRGADVESFPLFKNFFLIIIRFCVIIKKQINKKNCPLQKIKKGAFMIYTATPSSSVTSLPVSHLSRWAARSSRPTGQRRWAITPRISL